MQPESQDVTLGQIAKTLMAIAVDVRELRISVRRLTYSVPAIMALGLILIAVIVILRK